MDNLQKNLTKTMLILLGSFSGYLKNLLLTGLSYPFKQVLRESIDFLRTVENIQILDGRMSKGKLLEGPPGTGKTLLACAASGEAQVLFFNISGVEFIELYVGVDAVRLRKCLEQAWNKVVMLCAGRFHHQIVSTDSQALRSPSFPKSTQDRRLELSRPHSQFRDWERANAS